jgi:hypothetical protein
VIDPTSWSGWAHSRDEPNSRMDPGHDKRTGRSDPAPLGAMPGRLVAFTERLSRPGAHSCAIGYSADCRSVVDIGVVKIHRYTRASAEAPRVMVALQA